MALEEGHQIVIVQMRHVELRLANFQVAISVVGQKS
jgi:hypothetical protein